MNCLFVGGIWDGRVEPFDDPPDRVYAPIRRPVGVCRLDRMPSPSIRGFDYQTYNGYLNVCPGKCYFTIYVIDTMTLDDAWNRIFSFYINDRAAHVDTH